MLDGFCRLHLAEGLEPLSAMFWFHPPLTWLWPLTLKQSINLQPATKVSLCGCFYSAFFPLCLLASPFFLSHVRFTAPDLCPLFSPRNCVWTSKQCRGWVFTPHHGVRDVFKSNSVQAKSQHRGASTVWAIKFFLNLCLFRLMTWPISGPAWLLLGEELHLNYL